MVIDNTLRQQNGPDINANDNIIAVASGKGGVGKTWFSITPVSYTHLTLPTNREV